MDLIAAFGLLFCRIMVATGFRALAPSACFGGDTSTIGWEALIVLQDLRGLSPEDQLDTSLWAARALIRAALDEGGI